MKIKYYSLLSRKYFLALIAITLIASCKKALDINTDPNKALTATPELVLPAAQVELGLTVGNTWDFVGSMWAQYWTGGHGVSSSGLETYTMQSVDVQSAWTRSYERCLQDFNYLIKSGQPVYSGMAKICSAYEYQMLTDLFGAIPFSQALKGDEGIFTPSFDSEQDVYTGLITMIDEGIAEVQESGVGISSPGNEDLMFGGDISKWLKFANTLKLKVLVRGGKYVEAKALVDAGTDFISSNSESAQITWAETAQNTNPLYARFVSRAGIGMYYVAAASIVNKLVALNDPRADYFFKKPSLPAPNSPHLGVLSGEVNVLSQYISTPPTSGTSEDRRKNFSQPTSAVFSATTPTFFISGWESKFLQAEAVLRGGGDASTLFGEAVQLSFDFLGAGDATSYVSTLGFSGSIDNQLNVLGIQKWISMTSLQMAEGWLETLRFDRENNHIFTTGIFHSPSLSALGTGKYPTSFVYPTQEIALNPNTPNRTVSDRRFWDAN